MIYHAATVTPISTGTPASRKRKAVMKQPTTNPSEHRVSVTVAGSGEVIEYTFTNNNELATAYRDVVAHLNAYRELKNLMLDTSMQLIMRAAEKESKDVTE